MEDLKIHAEYQAIADIQKKQEDAILFKQNVVGVGVGHKVKNNRETGDTCLSVFVTHKLDPSMLGESDLIPKTIGKYKTDVVETGEIFAGDQMPATQEEVGIETLAGRVRPAMGGYSVGHYRITAGTIATGVVDADPAFGIPPKYYILSNNHVLANSNAAVIGDPVLQPGPYDGGTVAGARIGKLSRYIPIYFDGRNNVVDAAIAEVNFHDLNREIYWVGYVEGLSVNPRIPMFPNLPIGAIVRKTGRTTNYTTGKLTSFNATVNVNYGGGRVGKFVGQIITTAMSAGGDSGSLVVDYSNKAVGLLYAGSSSITILNPIYYVLSLLRIRLF